jgi:hypothetical protein
MKHVGKALIAATDRHRIITAVIFAGLWSLLEFYLHYEQAAKMVEMFGFAPFADRCIGLFIEDW